MKSRGAEALSSGQFGIGSFVLQQGIGHPAARIPPYIIWHLPASGMRLTVSAPRTATEMTVLIAFFIMK